MRVEGIYTNAGKNTLYVSSEPDEYMTDAANNRKFSGRFVKAVYIGNTYDISGIKVGSEIEIYYGTPMSTKSGVYAPIKKIEIIK